MFHSIVQYIASLFLLYIRFATFFFFFWHNEEYTRSELTLSCIAQTLPLVRLSGSKQCVEQAVASHLNMTITQGKETQ
jgi:hypothetical protein